MPSWDRTVAVALIDGVGAALVGRGWDVRLLG